MDDQQFRLHEVNNDIFKHESLASSLHRADSLRAPCIQHLAISRFMCYKLSRQQDDLEQSILHLTEAIFLPLPWHMCPLNMVQVLHLITVAIVIRAEKSRQPKDLKCCVTHLRNLRKRWNKVPDISFFPVTAILVCALEIQMDLVLGDAVQVIEEMADLCHELLDSDISIASMIAPILAFARAIDIHLQGPFDWKIPSERVISCLRKAIMCIPGLHQVSIVLAESLFNRFLIAALDDDYEEGMSILDKIFAFHAPGDSPSPYRGAALKLAFMFAQAQLSAHGKPEHLEKAILCCHALLDVYPLEDPLRAVAIDHLSYLQRLRFHDSTDRLSVQDILSSTFESVELPSYRDLTPLPEFNPNDPHCVATFIKHVDPLNVITIQRLTHIADIKEGVEYCQQFLASRSHSRELSHGIRSALGHFFYRAFECTNEIEYLSQAISAHRDAMNTTLEVIPMLSAVSFYDLTSCLTIRLDMLRQREDFNELMHLFPMVSKYRSLPLPVIQISCQWASTARHFGHPSTPAAYECALLFMQEVLTFAPTLDIQHSRLATIHDDFKSLPLHYASYHIQTSRVKQAIEVLERGRVLLWSEMRGLRTSVNQIRLADSQIAAKFAQVNRDLEGLMLASSPNDNVYGGDSDINGKNSYTHLVMRRQELLDDREKLISKIQALSGFADFLKPPPFDTLSSVASHGPVIIINHCEWRSDILILLKNAPPSLIPTSNSFYARAKEWQDQLLGARKKGLESNEYEDALRFILKELYELVGQPVIKRLNELDVPEQSRVWWCPTSVFCSLPLHAMGPIRSDKGSPQYFLDIYIPSYIPSLSALIESRKLRSRAMGTGKPSILLVAQPDERMPRALKEMKAVQAVDTRVTTLFSKKATPTAVLEHLRDNTFVHIVCHGILELGKPFEASFRLHRGKRLLLLDIVRSQLPDAEFAFLSACHTAELTENSIADEVLHLAAAMQFCGFRSVVGTMWAMADKDGRDLARDFYESVFSDDAQGVCYYKRTAEALRDATKNLRRKGGISLERWVNYVHYGA